jgi:hypothetical protein
VTIAPLLFNRIGTLGQSQQEQVIQEILRDQQAKIVFEKMQAFTNYRPNAEPNRPGRETGPRFSLPKLPSVSRPERSEAS